MKVVNFLKQAFIPIAVLAALLWLSSCNHQEQPGVRVEPGQVRESLIKANQVAVREEQQQIDDYIARHALNMQSTSTGLRYRIIKQGIGPRAKEGKSVTLSYTLTYLTGDTVYTSMKDGPIKFQIGKGQVISGLEEAILLLKVGDRAKIIIPSHLAFGLIGDQKKILHKATLVYDIEFISMF